ncbi:MAG TPA: DNA gyrase inhibitor YacG [Burkholderiaceae bacterium]|nr:DNA gyrase inhibitor YacG [Burkholderiaceae bacterium]
MAVEVDCPVCGRRTEYSPANRWRPFCSERCKLIDLGQWANDGYSIPGDAPADPEDPASRPPPAPPRRDA